MDGGEVCVTVGPVIGYPFLTTLVAYFATIGLGMKNYIRIKQKIEGIIENRTATGAEFHLFIVIDAIRGPQLRI
jgi:hypothetical protein